MESPAVSDEVTSVPETVDLFRWQLQNDFFLPWTPDIIPLKEGQRVVALGDIHGHIDHLRRCLRAARVIAEDGNDWIGGNAICVQLGDVLDRGYHEIECLLLLTKLARQAAVAGGVLVMLWGNHEVENADGVFTCTARSFTGDFDSQYAEVLDRVLDSDWRKGYDDSLKPARWAMFEPGGFLAKPFLSKLKVAVKVGRTVFVHGGLDVEHLTTNGGVAGMNQSASSWISEKVVLAGKSRIATLDENRPDWIDLSSSPLWMRDYSKGQPKEGVAERVTAVLNALQVDRMCVGHTVHDRINSVLDGKVWRLDIGKGIPSEYRRSPCIEPHMLVSQALEVSCSGGGMEKVLVLNKRLSATLVPKFAKESAPESVAAVNPTASPRSLRLHGLDVVLLIAQVTLLSAYFILLMNY